MKRISKVLMSGVAAGSLLSGIAYADPIRTITIDGNERVEDATIRSYLSFAQGDEYAPRMANDVIKTLYATGFFEHVEVAWDGRNFIVSVKENPLVNRVAFEDNKALDDSVLREIVSMKSRSIYSPNRVQRDVADIQNAYQQRGYYLTTVRPQLIRRDQNRVDVVYKITEGEKTKIERIGFTGNKHFSDADLRSVINTKESTWWRFLSSADVYHSERVEVDKELLRKFYIEHGFADFNVVSAVTELSKDKKKFFVTFTISEGQIYDFGNVDVRISSDEEGLSRDNLLAQLNIGEGERYNGRLVEDNIDKLIDYLGSHGFAFLDVEPRFTQDEANRRVGVTFDVVPGARVYVNRININGNDRTKDEVIRREMRLAEGDAFSSTKLKRSKDRLTYLGFFEDVRVERKETEDPDRLDLDITVAEQSTGEFNIGAGFSTYEGALATADIRERNFLGKGQDVRVAFAISGKRQDYNLSFTEPYFLGHQIAAGIDLFNEERDYQDESSHNIDRMGGSVRFRAPITEYVSNTVRLGGQEIDIKKVAQNASTFVERERGSKTSFTLSDTIALDTRDSYMLPTSGYRTALTVDYSGLGGDVEYLRTTLNGSWHHRITGDWILSLGGRLGYIDDLGKDLPFYENFTAGGSTLRGFEVSGIGPRDRVTDDALGGKFLVGHNAEVTFPLSSDLSEMGVHGILFSDGGMVTGFDQGNSSQVIDSKSYRVSVGAGIYWRSPMGPLRFDFGFPIVKEDEDKKQIFSFSFGTRF